MMDYPQQAPLMRPTSTGRINWTQTTTVTIATFVGCLAALLAAFYLYKHLLSKKLAQESARLDDVQDKLAYEEELLAQVIRERKTVAAQPKPQSVNVRTDAKADAQSSEKPGGNPDDEKEQQQEVDE